MKFIASLVDIKEVDKVPSELLPYVEFKATYEGRLLKGGEKVALFNVASTTSYLAVFLDPGKTLREIEAEVKNQAFADIHPESKNSLRKYLSEA
jgi:hypothetical protein